MTLLGTVGIESRAARGLRFPGEAGETMPVGPALLHRWVEVRDPDVGWVFSDPAVSLHHVSARYIHLSAGGREGPGVDSSLAGTSVTLLRIEGGLAPVDVEPGLEGGLPVRPAGEERYAAAVIGRAPPGSRVTLTGPTGARVERAGPGGRFAFLGLPAGIYRLEGAGRTEGFLLGARELRAAGARTRRAR
jgi:hypothetical protein